MDNNDKYMELSQRVNQVIVGMQATAGVVNAVVEDGKALAKLQATLELVEKRLGVICKIVTDGNGKAPLTELVGALQAEAVKLAADMVELEEDLNKALDGLAKQIVTERDARLKLEQAIHEKELARAQKETEELALKTKEKEQQQYMARIQWAVLAITTITALICAYYAKH